MMARPKPISRSTLKRLSPAKPCIRPMFITSVRDMKNTPRLLRHFRHFASGDRPPPARAPEEVLLVTLGERIRLDQTGRFGDDFVLSVRLRHADARFAPEVMVL